jgi:hypothetical protein
VWTGISLADKQNGRPAAEYVERLLLPALSLIALILAELKGSSWEVRSSLIGLTASFVLIGFYSPAKSTVKRYLERAKDRRVTEDALPELRRLAAGFAEFVSGRSDTLHYIAEGELCQGNGQLVARMSLPPISLWYQFSEYFSERASRHSARPNDLRATMMEFHHLVGSYNNFCVAGVFERLPQDLQHLMTPKAKSSLNGFQQRFVIFLKEYGDFVKTLTGRPVFDGLPSSFVPPKPL